MDGAKLDYWPSDSELSYNPVYSLMSGRRNKQLETSYAQVLCEDGQ